MVQLQELIKGKPYQLNVSRNINIELYLQVLQELNKNDMKIRKVIF